MIQTVLHELNKQNEYNTVYYIRLAKYICKKENRKLKSYESLERSRDSQHRLSEEQIYISDWNLPSWI